MKRARELASAAPPDLPDLEDLEEMEDSEREHFEQLIEAVTIALNPEQVREEVARLEQLAQRAKALEDAEAEAKLAKLRTVLREQGFFDNPDERLLLFTEFRDTLEYLVEKPLSARYPRLSTDRETADKHNLEWVTPGHPLFEALRRSTLDKARDSLADGACFFSLDVSSPMRIDFYRAKIVDGLAATVHERLFAVETLADGQTALRDPGVLGNLTAASAPPALPLVAQLPEPRAWLNDRALMPFLEEVRKDRAAEVERIARHVNLSLTELIYREDQRIARLQEDVDSGVDGAAGNLRQAEIRHEELTQRRERRRAELERQCSLTLQDVQRMTSVLVVPHPERDKPEVRNLRPDPQTEAIAMRFAMENERAQGRAVADVHERDLGYDITSLDSNSGDLRLIEVKGLAGDEGVVALTPNEKRTAEDRRDCYWLYVVTLCKRPEGPKLMQISDPAQLEWDEIRKIDHYALRLAALGRNETTPSS